MLLRNDGSVLSCGLNRDGQCNIRSLQSWSSYLGFAEPGLRYVLSPLPSLDRGLVLQLVFTRDPGALVLTCYTLAGREVLFLKPHASELASDLCNRIAGHLKEELQNLRLVLLHGQLLSEVCRANPRITVAGLSQIQ